MWEVFGTDEFDEWFGPLGDDAHADILAKVNLLRQRGPKLGRPHADTLNGSKYANMKELRANTAEQVFRIAFAFDPKRRAILLIGGDKHGVSQKKFYKQLIAKADRLYAAHLAEIDAQKESGE